MEISKGFEVYDKLLGKIPPQAIEIEEVILGALMIDTSAYDKISDMLSEQMFYLEANQKVFSAIVALFHSGSAIDIRTVTEMLRKNGNIESVGGPYYVVSLAMKVGSGAHIESHARIIIEKWLKRELINAGNVAISMGFDDGTDPFEIYDKTINALEMAQNFALGRRSPKVWGNILDRSYHQYIEKKDAFRKNEIVGIPTPVVELSKLLVGWQGGKLYIIAARPGMGKTAFVLEAIRVAALNGVPSAIFSLEMDDLSLADRMISGEAGVDAFKYRSGTLSNMEESMVVGAIQRLKNLNIFVDDTAMINFDTIRSRCRKLKSAGKLGMVVIDYIGLVGSDNVRGRNREQEVAEVSRKAKIMSKDLDVPVIIVSQLNREVERRNDRRPQLSDLRESGALEQDADAVILLYRKAAYNDGTFDESEKNMGEIILAKHRAGMIGTIKFAHNDNLTRFYSVNERGTPEVGF